MTLSPTRADTASRSFTSKPNRLGMYELFGTVHCCFCQMVLLDGGGPTQVCDGARNPQNAVKSPAGQLKLL